MKTRVLTGLLIIAVMTAILFVSFTIIYPIVISLLAAVAAYEMLKTLGLHKKLAVSIPAYVIAAAMPMLAYLLGEILGKPETLFIIILALALFVLMMWIFVVSVFMKNGTSFSDLCAGLVTVIYITASFSSLVILRYIDKIGLFCLGMALVGAWISDVFAYFTGVLFGKHKLIPEVSPKKTVEGSVGAIVCTTFSMMLYGFLVHLFSGLTPNYPVLAISGAVLSVVGQLGDLFASVVKREHGVKDYGTLLPGHGGIMDRFDSLLAVCAVAMIISLLFAPFS